MRNNVKLHVTRCQSCSAKLKLLKLHVHYRSTEIGLDNLGKILVTTRGYIRHYRPKADILVKDYAEGLSRWRFHSTEEYQEESRKESAWIHILRSTASTRGIFPLIQEKEGKKRTQARRGPRQEEDPDRKRTQANRLSESRSEAQEGQVFFFPKNK